MTCGWFLVIFYILYTRREKKKKTKTFLLLFFLHKWKTYHWDLNQLCWHTLDTFISMHKDEVMAEKQCILFYCFVLFNAGEKKKDLLVASVWVEQYLLTDWEHDTMWESLPLHLAPSVLLTGSLQWISLLYVCLLSHCGGRQTRHAQRQHLHVWPCVDNTCEWGLKSCAVIFPSPRKLHFSIVWLPWDRHAVEFIRDSPPACATAVTVLHILPCGAGIHQLDQMCQHVIYHSSGDSPTPTHFALYNVMNKIQRWWLIWPEAKAVVKKKM